MTPTKLTLLCTVIISLLSQVLLAQSDSKYFPDKSGVFNAAPFSSTHVSAPEKKVLATKLTAITEWFHKNNVVLSNPKGFDMLVNIQEWNPKELFYTRQPCYYGYFSEIDFLFQLFIYENGKQTKWTIEPPHWKIKINNTTAGHGSNFTNYEGYKVQVDDPSLEKPFDLATLKLSELFNVFPLEKEIAPGINLYGDGNLVLFNPNRPPFWIPVTVKEVLDLKLAFYKIRPNDKMVYDYIKTEYDKMTNEELNSFAYSGSEDGILDVNGQKMGPQIMRFNKEYWDKSLPPTAIQFITMYYLPHSEEQIQEYISNNGHPNYVQSLMDAIKISELGALIDKK